MLLMAFVQQGHGSPSALWHIRLTNSHETYNVSMMLTWFLACVGVVRVKISNNRVSTIKPVCVTDSKCNRLTLICIVFSFELELPSLCFQRHQSTLEFLLLAILGVFKDDVPLQIKTEYTGVESIY